MPVAQVSYSRCDNGERSASPAFTITAVAARAADRLIAGPDASVREGAAAPVPAGV
jgi:hypothetical protein